MLFKGAVLTVVQAAQQVAQTALPVVPHIHSNWELWGCFAAGQVAHLLARGVNAKNLPKKVNPIEGIWEYIKLNIPVFAVRAFVVGVLFSYWLNHPTVLTELVSKFVKMDLTLDISHATAAAFGFTSDFVADAVVLWIAVKYPKLSWVRKLFPKLSDEENGHSKEDETKPTQ